MGSNIHEKKKEKIKHNSTSILGTCFNLTNSIVGAGIVGIPFAIKESGFMVGIVLVICAALLTEKSLRMLISTAKSVQVKSYEELCEVCFGRIGYVFISFLMLLMAYGSMVSYLMILRDTFPMIFGITDDAEKKITLVIISACVIFPLSSQRDIADLAKTSCMNIFFDIGLVLTIAFVAWKTNPTDVVPTDDVKDDSPWNASVIRPDTIFIGIGILSFAFSCQHAAFIVANSLHDPTPQRWSRVTCLTLSLCGLMSLLMGVCGYMAFREDTEGDVMNNLSSIDQPILANVARLSMSLVMCFVYPVECFVARHVMSTYIFNFDENDDSQEMSTRQRVGLTFILYILSLVPACTLEELGNVLAITGTIGGSCLSYIVPGLTYLGVYGTDLLEMSSQCNCFLYYISLMPLWNFIIHRSLLVQSELSYQKDDFVLEMSNLKINAEINDDSMVDISLVEDDSLAYAYNSRRQGEGLIPRSNGDFVVAIGFIIIGFVAMCAGVMAEFKATTAHRVVF